ncbi:MAG: KH domain-containing protein [Anaerolineales bacterium]|nr:KH domain-containing protein [Anaerolineales bacterium]
MMKALIEFIAKSLVDDPTEVKVMEYRQRRDVRITLSVAEEDMGRVIGRNGRVANAMRTLLRVSASRRGMRVSLDII